MLEQALDTDAGATVDAPWACELPSPRLIQSDARIGVIRGVLVNTYRTVAHPL